MSKVFIVLDEEEQVLVERVCLDKNPEEALAFVLQHVAPKVHRKIPCMSAELMRPQG